jgi:circadian clock protein KaiB
MTTPHERAGVCCELTLFVSGASDLSAQAITDVRELCDVHLDAPSQLTVVDVHGESGSGLVDRVLATPTLVKNLPLPVRRIVGDLSDSRKVLRALDLPGNPPPPVRAIE